MWGASRAATARSLIPAHACLRPRLLPAQLVSNAKTLKTARLLKVPHLQQREQHGTAARPPVPSMIPHPGATTEPGFAMPVACTDMATYSEDLPPPARVSPACHRSQRSLPHLRRTPRRCAD